MMIATTRPVWNSSKPALRDIDWESGPDRQLTYNTYRETILRHYYNGQLHETPIECPSVRFHRTTILISCGSGIYILNSGGWQTSTTKQRLNALLWNHGIHIYQRNFEWFVSTSNGDVPFYDGMKVLAKGWEGCY